MEEVRQAPEELHEGGERQHGGEDRGGDRIGAGHVGADVLGDTLVGVVRDLAHVLDAVVAVVLQPVAARRPRDMWRRQRISMYWPKRYSITAKTTHWAARIRKVATSAQKAGSSMFWKLSKSAALPGVEQDQQVGLDEVDQDDPDQEAPADGALGQAQETQPAQAAGVGAGEIGLRQADGLAHHRQAGDADQDHREDGEGEREEGLGLERLHPVGRPGGQAAMGEDQEADGEGGEGDRVAGEEHAQEGEDAPAEEGAGGHDGAGGDDVEGHGVGRAHVGDGERCGEQGDEDAQHGHAGVFSLRRPHEWSGPQGRVNARFREAAGGVGGRRRAPVPCGGDRGGGGRISGRAGAVRRVRAGGFCAPWIGGAAAGLALSPQGFAFAPGAVDRGGGGRDRLPPAQGVACAPDTPRGLDRRRRRAKSSWAPLLTSPDPPRRDSLPRGS